MEQMASAETNTNAAEIGQETRRRVSIHLTTVQEDTGAPELFEQMKAEYSEVDFGDIEEKQAQESDTFEMITQGFIEIKDGRLTLRYDETELTGMEGATTTISFASDDRDSVTMLRYGAVTTALTFVKGRRHISTYDTGIMPFSLCVYTTALDNGLGINGGRLELDYLVEIRGAHAERNHLVLDVNPVDE